MNTNDFYLYLLLLENSISLFAFFSFMALILPSKYQVHLWGEK